MKFIFIVSSYFFFCLLGYSSSFRKTNYFRCNVDYRIKCLSETDRVLSCKSKAYSNDRLDTISQPLAQNEKYKIQTSRTLKQMSSVLLPIFAFNVIKPLKAKAAAQISETDFIDALQTIILAEKIWAPTKEYVNRQAYDAARSNIKYILDNLQFQKKVTFLLQNSIDFNDDESFMDNLESAQEAGSRITNTALQYDNTIYTCIFIPSEDGSVTPTQEKYRKQAYDFYEAFNKDIKTLLMLGTSKQLERAKLLAEKNEPSLPHLLFRDLNTVRTTGI